MRSAWREVRGVLHLDTASYELLPREWIALAFLLGAAAFWGGWYLGSWGFVENVLAGLVLVGPGLLVTNVLAAKWRRRRELETVVLALAATLQAVAPVFELVIKIAKTVSPRVPARRRLPDFKGHISIDQMNKLLHASETLLAVVPFGEDLKPGPYLPSELKVTPARAEALSGRVRSALLHLSAVHEFPQITSDGEELIQAIDAPFPCEVTQDAAEDFHAEFRVVDTEVPYRTWYGLRDIRSADVIVIQREDLIPWTAAMLYPLRNLLIEINIRHKLARDGIIEDNPSPLMFPRLDFRLIDKPKSWPTTSDSAQAGDEAAGP